MYLFRMVLRRHSRYWLAAWVDLVHGLLGVLTFGVLGLSDSVVRSSNWLAEHEGVEQEGLHRYIRELRAKRAATLK